MSFGKYLPLIYFLIFWQVQKAYLLFKGRTRTATFTDVILSSIVYATAYKQIMEILQTERFTQLEINSPGIKNKTLHISSAILSVKSRDGDQHF